MLCWAKISKSLEPSSCSYCQDKLILLDVVNLKWVTWDEITPLLAAKMQVTPLDRMTILRIEMQSDVLGERLSTSMINSCGFNFRSVTYLSDSQCTLATLAKETTALRV